MGGFKADFAQPQSPMGALDKRISALAVVVLDGATVPETRCQIIIQPNHFVLLGKDRTSGSSAGSVTRSNSQSGYSCV